MWFAHINMIEAQKVAHLMDMTTLHHFIAFTVRILLDRIYIFTIVER